MGGEVLTISSQAPHLLATIKQLGYSTISEPANGTVDIPVTNGENAIPHLVEACRANGAEIDSVSLKKPTLDDVFLKYTGARIDEGGSFKQASMARRTFRRLTK